MTTPAPTASGPGARDSRRRRWLRRSRFLKASGAYLDYCRYYGLFDDSQIQKLMDCATRFLWWLRGEDRKLRGLGCSERKFCPACGTYSSDMMALEAANDMLAAQAGLEIVYGVVPESYGGKVVLTLPKVLSAAIDKLPEEDRIAMLGRLFKLAYRWIAKFYGEGAGGVVGLDFTGESAPTEPHYHANCYVAPARRVEGEWVAIPKLLPLEELEAARKLWASLVKKDKVLGSLALEAAPEVDSYTLQVKYLKTPAQLRAWLRYLYRPALFDLWKGWDGLVGSDYQSGIRYHYSKKGCEPVHLELSADDVGAAVKRADTPPGWKRVRWFGIFSDSMKAATMKDLGLGAGEEVEGDGDEAQWVKEPGPGLLLVRFVAGGAIFKDSTGGLVEVSNAQIDYRPSGVNLGKRRRWKEPGG